MKKEKIIKKVRCNIETYLNTFGNHQCNRFKGHKGKHKCKFCTYEYD